MAGAWFVLRKVESADAMVRVVGFFALPFLQLSPIAGKYFFTVLISP